MKNFIQSRKFKMLVTAALVLQTLLVLSVIDGFGADSFKLSFRYRTIPLSSLEAMSRTYSYGSPPPEINNNYIYHYDLIIHDLLILILYGFFLFYFIRMIKNRKVRTAMVIYTAIIMVIACIDARINWIAAYHSPFQFTLQHSGVPTLLDPEADISPVIRVFDENKEREIQGAVFAVPIPAGRGKSYQGYYDLQETSDGIFNRFVPEDFIDNYSLQGIRPMHIQYFTWQYPGCELLMLDFKNHRRHFFRFDCRKTGISPIRFFFEDLISRYHGPSLPLDTWAALFKYAFESPYYTTDHIDDPYFLIERGEFEKAREKIGEIENPAVRQFLEEKLQRER